MQKNLSRLTAVVGTACLFLAVASSAKAYTITANGPLLPTSTFDATIDLAGTLGVTGSGLLKSGTKAALPFKVLGVASDPGATTPGTPTTSVSLNPGPTNVTSTPVDVGAGADWTLTDPTLHTLTDIQSLDVDLLNGATGYFEINQLHIYTNAVPAGIINDIAVDLNATLSGLSFAQTGAATLVSGGFGTGTFSLLGDLSGALTLINAQASVLGGLVAIPFPVSDQSISSPTALGGTYTVTSIPGGRHIELDGSVDLVIPLGLVTDLTTGISGILNMTISTTIDLLASVTISVGYHLEANVVPEPGSIILLGIGLAALVPVLRLRRKK